MRAINEIIVHCSATRPNWMEGKSAKAKRDEIRRWHLAKGWSDIGYHHLIDRDGTLVEGRPMQKTGAHVKGHNTGTIGVCLIGGHGSSENDEFHDNFTEAQNVALRKYIDDQKAQRPWIEKVSGHNEYAAKACPGFRVSEWLADVRPVVDAPPAPSATEVPAQGPWASIVAAILSIFGGRK